jgi:hypothetical protein
MFIYRISDDPYTALENPRSRSDSIQDYMQNPIPVESNTTKQQLRVNQLQLVTIIDPVFRYRAAKDT